MVCNNIFGCILPPSWLQKVRGGGGVARVRFGGFRVSQVLTSLSSDADLAMDWLYYERFIHHNHAIPSYLLIIIQVFLGLATFVWTLQVIEGRLCLRQIFGRGKISNHVIMWAGILLEDCPQIIITLLVDLFYNEKISTEGIINIATALHDGLTKIRVLVDDDLEEDDEDFFFSGASNSLLSQPKSEGSVLSSNA